MKPVVIALALWTGLGAASSVRAADGVVPPSTTPHLGTCGFTAGGFRLPGTDGCLRIGGAVAAEASVSAGGSWNLGSARAAPAVRPVGGDLARSGLGVGTRLSADMLLPTELGPVRAYVSLRGRNGFVTDRAAR